MDLPALNFEIRNQERGCDFLGCTHSACDCRASLTISGRVIVVRASRPKNCSRDGCTTINYQYINGPHGQGAHGVGSQHTTGMHGAGAGQAGCETTGGSQMVDGRLGRGRRTDSAVCRGAGSGRGLRTGGVYEAVLIGARSRESAIGARTGPIAVRAGSIG